MANGLSCNYIYVTLEINTRCGVWIILSLCFSFYRHYLDKEWGKYFEVNIKKQQPPNIAIMYRHEANISLISDEHRDEMKKRRWFWRYVVSLLCW